MKTLSQKVQNHGFRLTPLRKTLLEIFKNNKKPLTVPELQEKLLEKNLHPNKTSLYRNLENLCETNIVQVVMLETSVTHYELQTHHHHHFICQQCEKIKCIEDKDLEKSIQALEKQLQKKGFHITNHRFSISGICSACAS